jgi:HK97 family phage prohead protease
MSITKDYQAEIQKLEQNTVIAVISTDCVDRDGEVVLPQGLRKAQFQGNPIVLWTHDRKTFLPIGSCLWIKAEPHRLVAKYRLTDKTQLGKDIFGLLQDGVLKAHSINLNPIQSSPPTAQEIAERPDWASCRMVHRVWEMLEFSVCSIPCNPEALALAVAKCAPETKAWLGKAWEAEEDCIEWGDGGIPIPKQFNDILDNPQAVIDPHGVLKTEPEPQRIRQPEYCRSLSDIRKELQAVIDNAAKPSDILRMLKGQA